MKIKLLGTHTCQHCKLAVRYMTEKNIPFTEVFVEDPEGQKLAIENNVAQVPVLFVEKDDGTKEIVRNRAGEALAYMKAIA